MEIEYKEFVQALVKPGKVMKQQVTFDEFFLIESILSLGQYINSICFNSCAKDYPGNEDGDCFEFQHMIVGMHGEIGEMLDVVKNIIYYRKEVSSKKKGELDQTLGFTFKEEVGDFMFFFTGSLKFLQPKQKEDAEKAIYGLLNSIIDIWNKLYKDYSLSIEDAIKYNMQKLSKRYEGLKYSDTLAQERKDKTDEKKD